MAFPLKHLAYVTAVLGAALLLNGYNAGDSGPSLITISSTEKIVFVRPTGFSDARGSGPIWIVDADGKNARQLTSGADSQPALFKNRIAFTRAGQLWAMNADGSEQEQLNTDRVLSFRRITDPAWKPNGEAITFAGQETRNGFVHIYLLNAPVNFSASLNVKVNSSVALNPTQAKRRVGFNDKQACFTLRKRQNRAKILTEALFAGIAR